MTQEEKEKYGIEGPHEVDGWTIYGRDCENVYPTHDALWIDRQNKIMLIGYQGHHQDLFQSPFLSQLMQNASPYEQTAGHFRSEPSTTEPFPAGWGWHGNQGTKEEKNVLKQVLKQHYNVASLKDLYKPNEDAEENWFDDEGMAQ